jgi:hypothetical protein
VTTPLPPWPIEIQCHVAQAIGRSSYSWPPSRLLRMLPNAGTKNCKLFVFSTCFIRLSSWR